MRKDLVEQRAAVLRYAISRLRIRRSMVLHSLPTRGEAGADISLLPSYIWSTNLANDARFPLHLRPTTAQSEVVCKKSGHSYMVGPMEKV